MRIDTLAWCLTAVGAWAGGAGAAHAQGAPNNPPRDEGSIGAVLLAMPAYAGSDDRSTRLFPFISYRWANGWFAGIENGIGYNFSSRPDIQYGLRVTPDFGRNEDDSPDLSGMGDIDATLEPGAFFERRWGPWSARTALRLGSGNDNKGALFEVGAGYTYTLPPRTMLTFGLNTAYANRAYMQTYFGVDAEQ